MKNSNQNQKPKPAALGRGLGDIQKTDREEVLPFITVRSSNLPEPPKLAFDKVEERGPRRWAISYRYQPLFGPQHDGDFYAGSSPVVNFISRMISGRASA